MGRAARDSGGLPHPSHILGASSQNCPGTPPPGHGLQDFFCLQKDGAIDLRMPDAGEPAPAPAPREPEIAGAVAPGRVSSADVRLCDASSASFLCLVRRCHSARAPSLAAAPWPRRREVGSRTSKRRKSFRSWPRETVPSRRIGSFRAGRVDSSPIEISNAFCEICFGLSSVRSPEGGLRNRRCCAWGRVAGEKAFASLFPVQLSLTLRPEPITMLRRLRAYGLRTRLKF